MEIQQKSLFSQITCRYEAALEKLKAVTDALNAAAQMYAYGYTDHDDELDMSDIKLDDASPSAREG